MNTHLKFNANFFKEFWHLTKPFWQSEKKRKAFQLLILNLVCILAEIYSSVGLNHFNKDFFNALQLFDEADLFSSLWKFALLLILMITSYGYGSYLNGLLCILWREWLTFSYLDKWLVNHTHNQLQFSKSPIDNPDQRISEDIDKFTHHTVTIFLKFFQAVITLICFGYILWGLSGNFTISLGSFHFVIPGYLCWAALFYALIGTWLTQRIGNTLANLDYNQETLNANFRFHLIKIRESGEQISLLNGEKSEHRKMREHFNLIVTNFLDIISLQKKLVFLNNGYNTASYLFGIIIALPLYLAKKISLGIVMQISSAFSYVMSSFSIFVNTYNIIAEWRAVIHRLSEMDDLLTTDNLSKNTDLLVTTTHSDNLKINVSLTLPSSQILLPNITLNITKGKNYLLTGSRGTGKSILMRALAGIWPYTKGSIHHYPNAKIMFIPQKNYLPSGNLHDILLYSHDENVSIEKIQSVMTLCHLEKFIPFLFVTRPWERELSLSEQQLIAFARIFLQEPDILFLDECSSALCDITITNLYKKLRVYYPSMSIVSIDNRPILKNLHHHLIHLNQEITEKSHIFDTD